MSHFFTRNIAAAGAAAAVWLLAAAGADAATLDHTSFGTTTAGAPVEIYTMTNDHGMRVSFISYGGIITRIEVPDRNGRLDDVVLGLKTLKEYETISATIHFGAIIGRFANRIANARFALDGTTFHLEANDGANTLHSGTNGFDRKVWTVTPITVADGVGATLAYASPDGDEHFPGTLKAVVTYTLNNDNELRIDYEATTDKPTVVNFTNHSYFNLAGNGSGDVDDQMLLINADSYTPADAHSIPTGEIDTVAGTPLDFREMMPIGARLSSDFDQLVYAHGYDQNFVLNRKAGDDLVFAARAYDPKSGRVLDCFTTEPGLQIYTSNFLDGSVVGSADRVYRQTEAFTLETQHYPDSPNKPNFPTTELKPGETLHSTTIFRFATDASLPPLTR